jgi:murein DD-endopeptidase MepM/ murein hydrolase activator NlpD
MAKKFFSLIIVPNSRKSSKNFTISQKKIKTLLGISAFVVVLLIGFLADYFSMNVTRVKFRELSKENLMQKETIANYESYIARLKTTLENFENYAKKLNIMAGLKSPEVLKELGVGGPGVGKEEEANASPSGSQSLSFSSVKNLSQQADNIEKNLGTLVNFFEAQASRLASTPTIRPTAGWPSSAFGWRSDPFTGKQTFHQGIDFATNFGNPVVATADGLVVELKNDKMLGNSILLSHDGGYATLYGHLSKFLVKPGQKVKKGETIGLVGQTGKALGPHVHYEIRINNRAVNPYAWILEEE